MNQFNRLLWVIGLLVSWAQASGPLLNMKMKNAGTYRSKRSVWSTFQGPSVGSAQAIGSYAGGCIGGAMALPADGENFHAMRPSRNRQYGHPYLVETIHEIAYFNSLLSQGRLLVGDMVQPRGGPMKSGHASHQSGLDADIWFLFWTESRSPSPQERENLSSVSLLNSDGRSLNKNNWTTGRALLLKSVASMERVQRIFINPHIKKGMCELFPNSADHGWMKKLRPWLGHDYHFHVRLKCPEDSKECIPQSESLPADNGCGQDLAQWFKPDGSVVSPDPSGSSMPSTTIELPAACKLVENGN